MIYWDHNATTPCAPEVVIAMRRFWAEGFGNPASLHLAGQRAKRAISVARSQVAELMSCRPNEVVFTSGATESNNLIFLGLLLSPPTARRRVVVSAIEHKSILAPAAFLGARGFDVIHLPVSNQGIVDMDMAKKLINTDTALVSVQAANNEIGTLQPVTEIAQLAHAAGAYFHSDAAQALGKIPVSMDAWDCDFASVSAHKMYGPKGIGVLFVNGGTQKWPWAFPMTGGGQEGGLRPGTSNVPGIVGFGVACKIAKEIMPFESQRLQQLRSVLEERLSAEFPGCRIHASGADRLPGTTSVAFGRVPGDLLIDNIATLFIGRGSACSDGAIGPSHVLSAIGCSSSVADSTVRVSLGRGSSYEQIDAAIDLISKSLASLSQKLKGPSCVAP